MPHLFESSDTFDAWFALRDGEVREGERERERERGREREREEKPLSVYLYCTHSTLSMFHFVKVKQQTVGRLHKILKPFLLRRVKVARCAFSFVSFSLFVKRSFIGMDNIMQS